MEKKNEINRLFQKFVDKTINTDELKKFNAYLLQSDTDPQIRQLLTEMWDYLELTGKYKSDRSAREKMSQLQIKQQLLEKLVEENDKQRTAIAATIKKINEERSNRESANKRPGLWDWLKRMFVMP